MKILLIVLLVCEGNFSIAKTIDFTKGTFYIGLAAGNRIMISEEFQGVKPAFGYSGFVGWKINRFINFRFLAEFPSQHNGYNSNFFPDSINRISFARGSLEARCDFIDTKKIKGYLIGGLGSHTLEADKSFAGDGINMGGGIDFFFKDFFSFATEANFYPIAYDGYHISGESWEIGHPLAKPFDGTTWSIVMVGTYYFKIFRKN